MTQAAGRRGASRTGPDARRLAALARLSPFVLRLTRWSDMPGPVLAVKERRQKASGRPDLFNGSGAPERPRRGAGLKARGHIAGEAQRRVLPILRSIVARVKDESGVPLQLDRHLTPDAMRQPLTMPLDEEAGTKLALICRLHERIADLDRVELIARRIERLTAEEASYWHSRITRFDPAANRWAIAGLRVLLGGQPRDAAIGQMLERMRGA